MSARRVFRILTSVLVLLSVVNGLLRHDEYRKKDGPLETIAKASLCVVIFSVVELLKTLGGRFLSLRVHSKSLFSKLRVRIDAVWTRVGRCANTHLHAYYYSSDASGAAACRAAQASELPHQVPVRPPTRCCGLRNPPPLCCRKPLRRNKCFTSS